MNRASLWPQSLQYLLTRISRKSYYICAEITFLILVFVYNLKRIIRLFISLGQGQDDARISDNREISGDFITNESSHSYIVGLSRLASLDKSDKFLRNEFLNAGDTIKKELNRFSTYHVLQTAPPSLYRALCEFMLAADFNALNNNYFIEKSTSTPTKSLEHGPRFKVIEAFKQQIPLNTSVLQHFLDSMMISYYK